MVYAYQYSVFRRFSRWDLDNFPDTIPWVVLLYSPQKRIKIRIKYIIKYKKK